jgi:hypothetical protein
VILAGAQKTRRLIGIWTKDCACEVSHGYKTILRTGPEALHITLWQRTCLYFVLALRFCLRLNLKVMG